MQFKSDCIACLMRRQTGQISKYADEEKKLAYLKDVCAEIAKAPAGVAAPYLVSRFNRACKKYFDEEDIYGEVKKESNDFVLERLPKIEAEVNASADPVLSALKFARLGNYIDFGALHGAVDMDELDGKLMSALSSEQVDETEYKNLTRDLENARELVYILDNAGEIVLDKLFIEKIKEKYPRLLVTAAVRGAPVLNDVTLEDAEYTGLSEVCRVIDNGSDISGTQISEIGEELKSALLRADVIVAKGQGNFETMLGCGYNVYYLFLCKCDLFVRTFGVKKLTGVIFNEKRMPEFK